MSAKQRKRIEKLEHRVRQLAWRVQMQEIVVADAKRRAADAERREQDTISRCVLMVDVRPRVDEPDIMQCTYEFSRSGLLDFRAPADAIDMVARHTADKIREYLPGRKEPKPRWPTVTLLAMRSKAGAQSRPRRQTVISGESSIPDRMYAMADSAYERLGPDQIRRLAWKMNDDTLVQVLPFFFPPGSSLPIPGLGVVAQLLGHPVESHDDFEDGRIELGWRTGDPLEKAGLLP